MAVFGAVSASPLLAPCVEEEYSSTFNPSPKLASIGVSMVLPERLAIGPRILASWPICATPPRAPDSAMRTVGFRPTRPSRTSSRSRSITAPVIVPRAWVQASSTCLYGSCSAMAPR